MWLYGQVSFDAWSDTMVLKPFLSENLRKLRERDKLSQSQIASHLSVGLKTYQRWEDKNSTVWPDAPALIGLADLFNISAELLCKKELANNSESKIDRINTRLKSDQLYLALCSLACGMSGSELDAWLTLLEVQFLSANNSLPK